MIISAISPFAPRKACQPKAPSSNPSFNGWGKLYSAEMSMWQADKISKDFLLPKLKGKVNSLCDLGCGNAGPTAVLAYDFGIPLRKAVGVGNHAPYGNGHVIKYHRQDMLRYLDETDESFDLISLCRPCLSNNVRVPELIDAANKRLTKDGHFFTYGENFEMYEYIKACQAKGIECDVKKYDWPDMINYQSNDPYNLYAVLIPKFGA